MLEDFKSSPSEINTMEALPTESWEGPLPEGESNKDYHARKEISSSQLKYMLDSPFHFDRFVNKRMYQSEPSASMALGTLLHEYALEGKSDGWSLLPEFTTIKAPTITERKKHWIKENPEKDKKEMPKFEKLKDYTAAQQKEKWLEENKDIEVLTAKQAEVLIEMIASWNRSSFENLVFDAHCERGFLYKDPWTGIACKFRPDAYNEDQHIIYDLKTCESSGEYEFNKAVPRWNYHLSAAHYCIGYQRLFGVMPTFKFLLIQNTKPYPAAIRTLTKADLERAIDQRNKIMKDIKKCRDEGSWPEYSWNETKVNVPAYAFEYKSNI